MSRRAVALTPLDQEVSSVRRAMRPPRRPASGWSHIHSPGHETFALRRPKPRSPNAPLRPSVANGVRTRTFAAISQAWGTSRSRRTQPASPRARRFDGLLLELRDDGRLGVIRALKRRRITLAELYANRSEPDESCARELSIPASVVVLLVGQLEGIPAARSRVYKAAGIVTATIHDARHTFAIHAVQSAGAHP